MTRTITYKTALGNVNKHIEELFGEFDIWQGSTALALVFNMSKEQTIEDLIAFRQRSK